MPERFDDLPVLAGLGTSLRAAMAEAEAAAATADAATEPVAPHADRHARRWRRGPRNFGALSSILVLGVVGTAAAAATLTVLRGSPIPAPRPADLQPVMTARAETQRVLGLRATDPAGGATPAYALRTGESQGGLTCVTVGQVDEGEFGIVGTDGRFRKVPPTLIDGCGKETGRGPAVAGARILDSPKYADVRSVVYGVAGPNLRGASLEIRGKARPLDVQDGAFVTAVQGYPDDNGLVLRLSFDGGRTTTHEIGIGPMTVVDPSGPAWKLAGSGIERGTRMVRSCVQLVRARATGSTPSTANVCDATRGTRSGLPKHALSYDVRTFRPGDRGQFTPGRFILPQWSWYDAPARTIIWGQTDPKRIRRLTAVATDGSTATTTPSVNGAFAIVFDGTVPAAGMRVTVEWKDGRRDVHDGPVLPVGRPRK